MAAGAGQLKYVRVDCGDGDIFAGFGIEFPFKDGFQHQGIALLGGKLTEPIVDGAAGIADPKSFEYNTPGTVCG